MRHRVRKIDVHLVSAPVLGGFADATRKVETIGFVICSLVLLLVLMRVVDPVPWPTALLVSFGATFGMWYCLNKLLMIQLPNGWLSPWLG